MGSLMTVTPTPAQTTKQLLLEKGLALLTERGYDATSIGDVLKETGVPKGSFYHYFASKEAFCAELIALYESKKRAAYGPVFEDTSLSPLNRLRKILANSIRELQAHDFQRGCLIGTLGQEMAMRSPELQAALDGVYHRWGALYYDCFTQAVTAGELPETVDIHSLIHTYVMTLQGAILEAKITHAPLSFQRLHWLFFEQLGTPSHRLDEADEALLALPK